VNQNTEVDFKIINMCLLISTVKSCYRYICRCFRR